MKILYTSDYYGRIPLHYAQSYQIAKTLIVAGSKIYHRDNNGLTPLSTATAGATKAIIEHLTPESPYISRESHQDINALGKSLIESDFPKFYMILNAYKKMNYDLPTEDIIEYAKRLYKETSDERLNTLIQHLEKNG